MTDEPKAASSLVPLPLTLSVLPPVLNENMITAMMGADDYKYIYGNQKNAMLRFNKEDTTKEREKVKMMIANQLVLLNAAGNLEQPKLNKAVLPMKKEKSHNRKLIIRKRLVEEERKIERNEWTLSSEWMSCLVCVLEIALDDK